MNNTKALTGIARIPVMRFCPSDMGHVRRAHAGLSHARRLPLVGGGAEPGQRSRGHLEGLDEA